MRKLILGVDPGTTCGLAALTLDGKPIFIASRRNWSFPDMIQTILNLGEPVLMSTDVSPAPELLRKLSKKFNAVLFTPSIPMSVSEKQHLARKYAEQYSLELGSAHEIDALAAAVKAYQHYKGKFDQVEAKMKGAGVNIPADYVKALVLKGYTIKRAIQHLLRPEGIEPPLVKRIPREPHPRSLIDELREKLRRERERTRCLRELNKEMEREIESLQNKVMSLQRRIEELRDEEVKKIRRERAYQRLQDEVQNLRDRLKKVTAELEAYKDRFNALKRLRELESRGEMIPLKPVEKFTRSGLEKSFKLYHVRMGDRVLLLDGSGGGSSTAEMLAKRGVKVVLTRTPMAHQAVEVFLKYGIPTIKVEDGDIEWIEGLPYIKSKILRRLLEELREEEERRAIREINLIVEEHRRGLRYRTKN